MIPKSYIVCGLIAVAAIVLLMAGTRGFAIIPIIILARIAALMIVAISIWRIVFALHLELWIAVTISGAVIFYIYAYVAPFFSIKLYDLPTFVGPFVLVFAAAAVWRTGTLVTEAARQSSPGTEA
jgi:hypothetical protein